MNKLFGTDGIRGVPWEYPFTEEFIRKIGYAASVVLAGHHEHPGEQPAVLIGMDTRASGPRIKKALTRGLCANKFRVVDLGVISTPAVSYLLQRGEADFGIVISASHNPPEFNGIKFFSRDGLKLNDVIENKIEALLLSGEPLVFGSRKRAVQKKNYSRDHIDFIKSTVPSGFSLGGVKVVLDCSNGAAYKTGPKVFRELGAELTVMGDRPDGSNINVGCGALCTEAMRKETLRRGADFGISLDGDADRCMLSDEKGRLLDGDDILSIAAPFLRRAGRLTHSKAALTFMSNYGLVKYLKDNGIESVQVPVGDKNVTDAMQKEDLKIGGESSGHIIFREFSPTGDGLLTALQVLAAVRGMGKSLGHFKGLWQRYPQVVASLKVAAKPPLETVSGFNEKIVEFEDKLNGNGRIFIRYSGTEPLLRILVEGESGTDIQAIADDLLEHYKKYSGALATAGKAAG